MRRGRAGIDWSAKYVVRVVRGICGCTGIDCSVFVVVRVVRGFMGGGQECLICEVYL